MRYAPEIAAVIIIALALAVLLYGVTNRVTVEVPAQATPLPLCAITLNGVTTAIDCDPGGPIICTTPYTLPVCTTLPTE